MFTSNMLDVGEWRQMIVGISRDRGGLDLGVSVDC